MKINLTETTMNIVINKLAELNNENKIRLVSSLGKDLTKKEVEEEIFYLERNQESIYEIAGLLGVDLEKFEEISEMDRGLEA